MSCKIVIVNYGMGNVKSIANMLRKVGAHSEITSELSTLEKAEKIILPGVGAFDAGMRNLKKIGLLDLLNRRVIDDKVPILGICLGMHLFANLSEEGELQGLGWIDADVKRFDFAVVLNKNLKVPHIGWNEVNPAMGHSLFTGVRMPMRFYFAHTFHYICHDKTNVLATAHYGYDFTCAVVKDNILGVQFHPEKSHKYGMQILKNFAESC